MQSPHQPGIGLKPGSQTLPANVLQDVKQVQEEAARQQAPHGGYGEVNPGDGVPGQNMPPPLMHMESGQGGNLLPMDQWYRYIGGTDQGPQLAQAQGQLSADHMPQANQASRQTMSQMFLSRTNVKQALQQLVTVLKSPQTPEQQQQILQIVKSNPQLKAAFMKQRQNRAEHTLAQAQGQLSANHMPQANQAGRQTMSQMFLSRTNVKQALQQLVTVLKSPQTPEQQQQILQIVKSNPQLKAAFMKQRQNRAEHTLAQAQGQLSANHMPQANQAGRQTMSQMFLSRTNVKQALQQLVTVLKSPQTPEQQQQILQIVKSNPQLKAAFMKQRQNRAEHTLAQAQGQLSADHMPQANQAGRQTISQMFPSGTNNKQALQQLVMVLKSPQTREQQQQILQIVKSNPQLMAAFMKQRQNRAEHTLAQAQGQLSADHMPQANQAGRPTISHMFPSGTNNKQALQQLVMVLKSPQTPEQQQQILQIVKSNPQLMAAFMKQRQNRAEHTLAQAQGQLSADHMPQANQAGRQTISQMFPSGTNNKQALQQLVMVLKSPQTPEQQQQILQIVKSNPQLMAAFMKQRQNRAEHTLAQAQGQLSADHMPQANQAGRQTISQMFPSGTNNKQALQQLVMVLKSPQTPEQQQQILQILKSNPQLMTAFIKLRQKMSIDILDVTLSPTTKGWFNQRFREVLQDDQEHWDNTSHNLGRVPRHPRMQCCHPMSKLQDEPIMSSWKTFQVHLKRFKSIQHARRGNLKQTSSLLLQEERRKTSYSCKTQEPRQNPSFKVRRSWTGPLQDVTSYLQPTRQDSYYLCTRIFDLFTI